MFDVDDLTNDAARTHLRRIMNELDKLDEDDFFGSEGWKHRFGYED